MNRYFLLLGLVAISIVSIQAQSVLPSGEPSGGPSTTAPTGSPEADPPSVATGAPTAATTPVPSAPSPTATFPTAAPVAPTPGSSDECINSVCVPGTDDCSCIPGLECRQRSDGQGNFSFLCSAIFKTTKNRISDGQGGAAGRNPGRERIVDQP